MPSCKQDINVKAMQDTQISLPGLVYPSLPGLGRYVIQSLRLPERFPACELLMTTGQLHLKVSPITSPYLKFSLSFPPKLNQLILTCQVLWLSLLPTWLPRPQNPPSSHRLLNSFLQISFKVILSFSFPLPLS